MSKKTIFLLLTIIAGIFIGWPHLNFYNILSVGDHGRDLYAYDQVYKGLLVDRDIWWVYGPLMPYYYGLFFLIFGVKISSILLGKFLLNILCGVFFYLASAVVMPALWAFLAACYFLQSQQDFFFTFNHIGGIAAELAVLWLILKYLYSKDLRFGFGALAASCLLGFIKINFGVTLLAATLLSIALINYTSNKDKKIITSKTRSFYLCGALLVPLIWAAIYWIFLKDLTLYEIRQCHPYFGDDQPYHRTVFETVPYYVTQHLLTIKHHWMKFQSILEPLLTLSPAMLNPIVALMFTIITMTFVSNLILHASTIAALMFSFTKQFDTQRQKFWLTLAIIWMIFALNFHEFVVSGVWYRSFWSQPFLLFFNFFMIATAAAFFPRWLRYCLAGFWIVITVVTISISIPSARSNCTPERFLNFPRGQIYVGNERGWVETVNNATAFLNQNLKKDELFFALPYDCLYYYTTGRPSPTRQLIFFDHIKIPARQEVSIIKELESKKTAYVLISNRYMSSETGLGILGKTYCPLIYQYIMNNFEPVYRYGGNWQSEPGWGNNHGVIIFKRKLGTAPYFVK